MTNTVHSLPPPPPPPSASEVESKLLGAVFDLGSTPMDKLELFEAAGLQRDDFADQRVALVWSLARRMAERRREVTAFTVFSAGAGTPQAPGLLDRDSYAWLQSLQNTNSLTREAFIQVSMDVRMAARGRGVAARLEDLARRLRSGRYSPAGVAADLEAHGYALSAQNLSTETAASDVMHILERWDEREKSGKPALLPTRIKAIDDVIAGWDYEVNVIVGQPGTGKNGLAAGFMVPQLEADPELKIGVFALEGGSEWLPKRWIAAGLGVSVRDVGSSQRTAEQKEKLIDVVAPQVHKLMERVYVYREDEISLNAWLQQATYWVRVCGVQEIVIDNLGQMGDAMGPGDKRLQVGQIVKVFARFARRYKVPVVLLCHTPRPKDDVERPPMMSEIQDSAYVERRARKILGLWTKGNALRCTVLKDQEGKGKNTTIELEQFTDAALVDPAGGTQVDIRSENRKAKAEAEHERDQRAVAASLRRADLKAKALAAANPAPVEQKKEEPAPQLTLLEAPKADSRE